MPITLDHNTWVQWIELGDHAHPRQIVVDFGRPGLRFSVSMRELIQWTAYRLDSASDDYIDSHRAAVILREISNEYYAPFEDATECLIEELADDGSTENFNFEIPGAPRVDARLLHLVDGHVFVQDTFGEMLWSDQEPTPVLSRNVAKTLDFSFPEPAVSRYGIVGIRVATLDLIHWFQSAGDLREMAFQDEEIWLDALDLSHRRGQLNADHRSDARLRARYGDANVDRTDENPTTIADADTILRELPRLIGEPSDSAEHEVTVDRKLNP